MLLSTANHPGKIQTTYLIYGQEIKKITIYLQEPFGFWDQISYMWRELLK